MYRVKDGATHYIIIYIYVIVKQNYDFKGDYGPGEPHSCSVTDPSVVGELYLPRNGKKLLDFIFIDLFCCKLKLL